ncbi:MAG: hypothetical protein ACM335_10815, partial [Deltaproteobacteria bacterium]
MKRKEKGRLRLWIFVLVMLAAGILAGYFFGMEQGRKDAEKPVADKELTTKTQAPPEEVPIAKGPVVIPEEKELKSIDVKSYCERGEQEIQDYFKYLNGKSYVRHLTEGGDTYARYKAMIRKLSAKLPVPAGEGIDSSIMGENIFWFFRALDKN